MKYNEIALPSHAVRATRFFYGPSIKKSIAFVGDLAECREFIKMDGEAIYHLGHNESSRSDLKIVTRNSLSASAWQDAQHVKYDQDRG